MNSLVASLLALTVALASAEDAGLEFDFPKLTAANFDSMTEGKTVFLMCYAPWCGHCKSMKPDFEKLANDWKGHAVGLVAGIDCTEEDELCQTMQVQGFPTIMYGDPSDPESYEGGRTYEELSEFTKEHISKPVCSLKNIDVCDDATKKAVKELQSKSVDELKAAGEEVVAKLDAIEKAFYDEVEKLQEAYTTMSEKFNADTATASAESNFKLLKAVLKEKGGALAPKDGAADEF